MRLFSIFVSTTSSCLPELNNREQAEQVSLPLRIAVVDDDLVLGAFNEVVVEVVVRLILVVDVNGVGAHVVAADTAGLLGGGATGPEFLFIFPLSYEQVKS